MSTQQNAQNEHHVYTVNDLEEDHKNGIPMRMEIYSSYCNIPNYTEEDFQHDLHQQRIRSIVFPNKQNYFSAYLQHLEGLEYLRAKDYVQC